MRWSNVGIALGQRLSAHEKLKLITCEWLMCGTGNLRGEKEISSRAICGKLIHFGHFLSIHSGMNKAHNTKGRP
jgi:hypothetical protein